MTIVPTMSPTPLLGHDLSEIRKSRIIMTIFLLGSFVFLVTCTVVRMKLRANRRERRYIEPLMEE